MTSGYIDPQDQISAIRLGVTPVLTKPFSRKKLLAALHDIFQERRELDKSQSVPGGRLSQLAKKKNY
jgi:DNA-binding response OmpR family regulator